MLTIALLNLKSRIKFLDNMITPIPEHNRKTIFINLIQHGLLGKNGKISPLGLMLSNIQIKTGF